MSRENEIFFIDTTENRHELIPSCKVT